MFETSVVHAQAKAARGRFGLFTVSLIAHSAVILGVAAVGVASVDFPPMAPDELANAPIFMPVTIPPPLGTPDGGGAPPKPPVEKADTPPPPLPTQETAPPVVPDDIPVSDTPSNGDVTSTGPATGPGTQPGPIGVPWGVKDGIGDINTPPAIIAAPPVEEKVYQPGGEVLPPIALRKVQPPYPTSLLRTRLRATVIVRCVIDKNGNVRDPQILKPAMPPFNDAVVETVTQWKFKPGSYRGVAVETYLDLTVNFAVN